MSSQMYVNPDNKYLTVLPENEENIYQQITSGYSNPYEVPIVKPEFKIIENPVKFEIENVVHKYDVLQEVVKREEDWTERENNWTREKLKIIMQNNKKYQLVLVSGICVLLLSVIAMSYLFAIYRVMVVSLKEVQDENLHLKETFENFKNNAEKEKLFFSESLDAVQKDLNTKIDLIVESSNDGTRKNPVDTTNTQYGYQSQNNPYQGYNSYGGYGGNTFGSNGSLKF